jgi:negative regulator of genetic competence, sporulation and motility
MDDLIQEIEDYKNNDATDEGDEFEESVIFMFSNVDNLITSAKQVDGIYKGVSDLYEIEGNYVLLLDAELEDAESYQYSCDIISEYADDTLFSDLTQSIILEHFEPVIEGDALTQLAKL